MFMESLQKLETALGNGKATALSRSLIILFSVVGMGTGGAICYEMPSVVSMVIELRDNSRDNKAFIADVERRRVMRDNENNAQDAALARHDREINALNSRVSRIEGIMSGPAGVHR